MSSKSRDKVPQQGRLKWLTDAELKKTLGIVDDDLTVAISEECTNGSGCTYEDLNEILKQLIDANEHRLAVAVISSNKRVER